MYGNIAHLIIYRGSDSYSVIGTTAAAGESATNVTTSPFHRVFTKSSPSSTEISQPLPTSRPGDFTVISSAEDMALLKKILENAKKAELENIRPASATKPREPEVCVNSAASVDASENHVAQPEAIKPASAEAELVTSDGVGSQSVYENSVFQPATIHHPDIISTSPVGVALNTPGTEGISTTTNISQPSGVFVDDNTGNNTDTGSNWIEAKPEATEEQEFFNPASANATPAAENITPDVSEGLIINTDTEPNWIEAKPVGTDDQEEFFNPASNNATPASENTTPDGPEGLALPSKELGSTNAILAVNITDTGLTEMKELFNNIVGSNSSASSESVNGSVSGSTSSTKPSSPVSTVPEVSTSNTVELNKPEKPKNDTTCKCSCEFLENYTWKDSGAGRNIGPRMIIVPIVTVVVGRALVQS
ncbi:hypothetical protein BZA77DRAFT_294571 [Pyronema omphalodes]|nr:hypothetical protein BZA77DRAFT_294571 [Pyronema omphalodes]